MRFFTAFCTLLIICASAQAVDHNSLKPAISHLRTFANSPDVIKVIKSQTQHRTIRELLKIDQLWRIEPGIENKIFNTDAQGLLLEFMAKHNAVFVEMIVIGSQGETLGAIPKTSDYWQGDEAKFKQVMGHGDIFIDAMDWDESSQTISAQISVPVFADNEVIGVITGAVEASLKALGDVELR